MTNRLESAASAYLRSAAHQPIAWYPWSEEAFAAARRHDKPVLLDIGAVWCHWCHVMDGESYDDPALASLLNEAFVCIKVDRDERPDVDVRYQRAVQALSGQGGWPLTAFLTPEGQVFYGGTYFPPDGKYGRPGFRTVLEQVRRVYHEQRDRVDQQALAIRRALATLEAEPEPGPIGPETLATGAARMVDLFDTRNGGFGTAPKFPHPAAVRFLLTRARDTGDSRLRDIAGLTLAGMARGGIHDQLAGGFHRYSVDAEWIVPHFEKMSYDNAELLRAYVDGALALGDPVLEEVARGIVRFVRQVLADPDGGYGASQDADVGLDDDGDYFTWTLAEAEQALGDPDLLAVAAACYDIGTAGEMQHDPARNVLFLAEPLPAVARRLALSPEEAGRRLARARERLLAARHARPTPLVDRTRYTGWNGMLAGALIQAGTSLGDSWALEHGLRTLGRIRREQDDPFSLRHGPGGMSGLLDDQVQVALAALEAFEATADPSWLRWSEGLLDRVWQTHHDPERGGLWDTAAAGGGPGLLTTRLKPVQDAPTPSANGIAAQAALRLGEHTGEPRWRERVGELLASLAGAAAESGLFGASLLIAADWWQGPAAHLVVVTGEELDAEGLADQLYREALRTWLPRRVVRRVPRAGLARTALPPALAAMVGAASGTRAYACVGASCRSPATTPEAWRATLDDLLRG